MISQHLRRFPLAQLPSLMPIEQRFEPDLSNSLQHSCPAHPAPPFERFCNGQFTRYKIGAVHEFSYTPDRPC